MYGTDENMRQLFQMRDNKEVYDRLIEEMMEVAVGKEVNK